VRFLVVCDAIARYGLSLIDALCISSCARSLTVRTTMQRRCRTTQPIQLRWRQVAAGHFIGVHREDSRLPAAPCRGNTTRTKEPQEDNEAAAAAN